MIDQPKHTSSGPEADQGRRAAQDWVERAIDAGLDDAARLLDAGALRAHLEQVHARLAAAARPVDLKEYAKSGYPDLRRATVVTVYKPWTWVHPLDSRLAQLIRRYQARLLDLPEDAVSEHHAMLYLGNGWCASQGAEMGLVHINDYRGCRLAFWSWPPWMQVSPAQRDCLGMECVVATGEPYGYGDILGLWALATTGSERLLELLADQERMICSERVCAEVRQHLWAGFAGESTCLRAVPHWLAAWMASAGFSPTVLHLS